MSPSSNEIPPFSTALVQASSRPQDESQGHFNIAKPAAVSATPAVPVVSNIANTPALVVAELAPSGNFHPIVGPTVAPLQSTALPESGISTSKTFVGSPDQQRSSTLPLGLNSQVLHQDGKRSLVLDEPADSPKESPAKIQKIEQTQPVDPSPRTSRFYRLVGSGSDPKNGDSGPSHHYHPFLYPQHKSRASPFLDIGGLPKRYFNDTSAPLYTSIPTLKPTKEEFADPAKFIDSIAELGEKYGAVKIIPPDGILQDKPSLNTELFWFKTKRQLLASLKTELNSRSQFYKSIISFYRKTDETFSLKLPSIDKRTLDLHRLHNSVRLKGGYDVVCQKKLWAQIGRELGYCGKITSSLSSSLKSAYLRMVYQFDLFEAGLISEPIPENDLTIQKDSWKSPNAAGLRKVPVLQHLMGSPIESPLDWKSLSSEDLEAYKKRLVEHQSYHVNGSSSQLRRPRDLLINKGFRINFDTLTDVRVGVTSPTEATLGSYDFYHWAGSLVVEDSSDSELQHSPLYNLKQFVDRNSKFEENTILQNGDSYPTSRELESLFWKVLGDDETSIEVESAAGIPSIVHDTTFQSVNKFDAEIASRRSDTLNPWNLNNLGINPSFLLSYLSEESLDSLVRPSIDIGMLFSCVSWKLEDHFLCLADYLHIGERKVWYFVPPHHQQKFEEVLQMVVSEREQKLQKEREQIDEFKQNVEGSDNVHISLDDTLTELETNLPHRYGLKDVVLDDLFPRVEPLVKSDDVFISPELLLAHGIDVYSSYQQPGELIIKFPKAVSSSVSLGLTVSESVNFAPSSWIPYAYEAENWLAKQHLPPRFSTFRLAKIISEECKDIGVLKRMSEVVSPVIDKEIELRKALREIPDVETVVAVLRNEEEKELITDIDVSFGYPSKVVIFHGENSVSVSSKVFLEKYQQMKEDDSKKISRIELHTFESDNSLLELKRTLQQSATAGENWLERLREMYEASERVQLKTLKQLYVDGKHLLPFQYDDPAVGKEIAEGFESVKRVLHECEQWVEQAQKFISIKHQSRTRGRRGHTSDVQDKMEVDLVPESLNVSALQELLEFIPKIPVTCPEIDQLLELGNEVEQFEISARSMLDSPTASSKQELENMITLGQSLALPLESLSFLRRLMRRIVWSENMDNLENNIPDPAHLQALIVEGMEVASESDRERIQKCQELHDKVVHANNVIYSWLSIPMLEIAPLMDLEREYRDFPYSPELKFRLTDVISIYNSVKSKSEDYARRTELVNEAKRELLDIVSTANATTSVPSYSFLQVNADKMKEIAEMSPSPFEVHEVMQQAATFANVVTNFNVIPSFKFLEDLASKFMSTSLSSVGNLKRELESAAIQSNKILQAEADIFIPHSSTNNKYFCFCREMESGYMIECEVCREWYHFKCVGISKPRGKKELVFVCPICDSKRLKRSTSNHSRDLNKRPKLDPLAALIKTGFQTMTYFPPEFNLVLDMVVKATAFKNEVQAAFPDMSFEKRIIKKEMLDLNKIRFYIRKLEGLGILLEAEHSVLKAALQIATESAQKVSEGVPSTSEDGVATLVLPVEVETLQGSEELPLPELAPVTTKVCNKPEASENFQVTMEAFQKSTNTPFEDSSLAAGETEKVNPVSEVLSNGAADTLSKVSATEKEESKDVGDVGVATAEPEIREEVPEEVGAQPFEPKILASTQDDVSAPSPVNIVAPLVEESSNVEGIQVEASPVELAPLPPHPKLDNSNPEVIPVIPVIPPVSAEPPIPSSHEFESNDTPKDAVPQPSAMQSSPTDSHTEGKGEIKKE
ncbi:unnamed protein product [Kuraishia capsulata CBS 1993]|uniref:Protein ECM5 n=1 Tax=Kuraishia capsulata CBS 1993 TaxID=1382522 RepID=W6MMJ8_9ASCO|nr:uncharacterized protein KUCA_T00003760001 [Kuraishia capsulata CBS 1993]CDK27781.1 unnamed protein product [Kuraishia capsulata CBS 1993]